jgi:hypothetical protein
MDIGKIVVQFDPTPRPVQELAALWGQSVANLNRWCAKGWIPGAFKHPSGTWFYQPLALLDFDRTIIRGGENEANEGYGVGRSDREFLLRTSKALPDAGRIRPRQRNRGSR